MSSLETTPPFPLSIRDRNQQQIDISWSSLASEPAVRIYVNSPEGETLGCAHLTLEQATAVRDAITAWMEQTVEPASTTANGE